ncbi:hypothetical protein [Granulicoccus sp. GXG6511]|uniref:hypothetical protein n=1 Tax=Granulicoccus sp. GXG6511 TaxID=3381351 RepID=UPI003D7EAE57
MTNDANDDRSRRDADSAPEDGLPEPKAVDSEQPSARPRQGWSDSAAEDSAPTPSDAEHLNVGSDDDSTIKGTPTPGHQTPTGRREEGPSIVARPLTGTTPKATNEPPQAPSGAGSRPTAPKPIEDGPREVVPDFRPAASSSTPPRATSSAAAAHDATADESSAADTSAAAAGSGDGEPLTRPDNPFAPKSEHEPESKTRSQKRRRTPDEETTTGKRAAARPKRFGRKADAAPDERGPLGGRNVVALAVAGVAVVAIVALIVSTVLWWFTRDTDMAGNAAPDEQTTPGPVLSAEMMLNREMATLIDPSRTWTQTLDQAGVNDSSPGIACIGPLAADQPIPEITQLRGLTASGTDRTGALHRADAYATNEEAQKVFEFRSAELGSCTDTPLYVEKGLDVTGLGDQALGVRLVLHDNKPEYHSVLLVRTGKVVNLLDVARVDEPADMEAQVTALGESINRQCGPAVGLCTAPTTSVEIGVPPAGGEQPGFLTSGDIPRVSPGVGTWRGNPPATRVDVQDGSSCEAIDFASIGGTGVTRQQRTYLLRNDAAAPPQFGIDQVVLTLGSPEEASELVGRINGNITSCNTRTLTSQMVKEAPLITPGQDGVEIRGHWYIVDSKVDQAQTQKYRVGIFSAGNKLVYLRSNPTETFDFTDDAWIGVNLRAGERITQVE